MIRWECPSIPIVFIVLDAATYAAAVMLKTGVDRRGLNRLAYLDKLGLRTPVYVDAVCKVSSLVPHEKDKLFWN